jgi:hypothetical protein
LKFKKGEIDMKKYNLVILLTVFLSCFAATSAFAQWYKCKITNITPSTTGAVTIRFVPGIDELGFTGEAKATIDPTDVGAKNMLATALTAVSLNSEITLNLATTPSSTTQYIDGLSLALQ